MQITINGQAVQVIDGTLNIDDAIGERSTCSFVVRDDAGAAHYQKGQPVTVIDDDGNLIFGGVIDSAQEIKPGPGPLLLHTIRCADWHYLLDKRIVAKAYEDALAGDIVQNLIDEYLAAEGIIGRQEPLSFARATPAYGRITGAQVASGVPRFEAGGLLVEEGTTNLLTANQSSVETDTAGFVAYGSTLIRDIVEKWHGSASLKCITGGAAGAEGWEHSPGVAASPSTAYTFSIWLKGSGTAYIWLRERDSSNVVVKDTYQAVTLTSTWTRYSITVTTQPTTATISGIVATTTAQAVTFWADGMQIEQRSYTTSWTLGDSTRAADQPTVPGLGALLGEHGPWTIRARCTFPSNAMWRPAFAAWPKFYVAMNPTSDVVISWMDGTQKSGYGAKAPNDGQEHVWTMTFDGSMVVVYIDGVQCAAAATSLPTAWPASGLTVGYVANYNWCNGLVRDLLMDRIAWTPERVAADAASSQTVIAPETVAYYPLDGTLDATNTIDDGPVIKEAVLNYVPATNALDALAEQAGYWWRITPGKRLEFRERAAYAAPWVATAADMLHDSVSVEHGNPKYRNRQYIRGGRDVTDPQTETRRGDGDTRSFALGFPIAKAPTVTVNGVPQTVGIKGVDTGKQWYWSKGDPVLTQDPSAAPLAATDTLSVTYQGEYDIIVLSEDPAAIMDRQSVEGGGTGYVEDVADEPNISSREAAFQLAAAKLRQYAVIGRRLKFRTRRPGLRPGQLLTVQLPEHGLDGTEMLIESVSISDQAGILWYDVTAAEGPEQGSWSRMFKAMATRGQAFVERVNIGEDKVLIVLQQVSEQWPWAETVTPRVFACPVPSDALYPSDTLYPC